VNHFSTIVEKSSFRLRGKIGIDVTLYLSSLKDYVALSSLTTFEKFVTLDDL
jgi:hypothetical protein